MEEYNQPTNFNMAIATLQRMDTILRFISDAAYQGNLFMWSTYLRELRRNIIPFIKKTEDENITDMFNKLNFKWTDASGKIILRHRQEVYFILDELTITMQRAMKEAGLLMPKSDDPRFAIRQ